MRKAGSILLTLLFTFTVIGILLCPYGPQDMEYAGKLAGASWKHWFGCDQFGRDLFIRVLYGMANSFLVGTVTVLIGAVFGTVIGAYTGYFGGWTDLIVMRINDAAFAFPSILLALVLVSLTGSGKWNVILALGIAFIPSFARVVRSEFIKYRNRGFVDSAKMMGAGSFRIIWITIFPNTLPVLFSFLTIGFNNAVLAEAGLSFLGIGINPSDPSLGSMISESQTYLFLAPHMALIPAFMITLMVLGFSLLGREDKKKGAI